LERAVSLRGRSAVERRRAATQGLLLVAVGFLTALIFAHLPRPSTYYIPLAGSITGSLVMLAGVYRLARALG